VFDPRQRQRIFTLVSVSRPALGPPSLVSNGYRGFFPGGKAQRRRDADHSPHLVPRSWMSTRYISSPVCICMAKAGQFFTFYYLLGVSEEKHVVPISNTAFDNNVNYSLSISCFHVFAVDFIMLLRFSGFSRPRRWKLTNSRVARPRKPVVSAPVVLLKDWTAFYSAGLLVVWYQFALR
jgi:hypothetical protein